MRLFAERRAGLSERRALLGDGCFRAGHLEAGQVLEGIQRQRVPVEGRQLRPAFGVDFVAGELGVAQEGRDAEVGNGQFAEQPAADG